MTFKIKDNDKIIVNAEKTFAITWMNTIELTDYKSMDWDDFLNILELQTMRRNPSYSTYWVKKAEKILDCLGYDIKDSVVHYYEAPTPGDRLPLVIEIQTTYTTLAILLSPRTPMGK